VPAERVKILEDNDVVRVPPFEIRAIATPGHASHHHIYHWGDNVFGGDIAGVRIGNGPPIPPFVPPELQVESWLDSIHKIRALEPANLYLPHFGKIAGSISEHLDLLDERVTHWSEWFRDRIRHGDDESKLRSTFAELEHSELRKGGASQDDVDGYEAADPSYMAVGAAIRYWKKFHPERIARYDEAKVAELLANAGIVRNRLKVAAAVSNAKAYLRLREEGLTLDSYLWAFVDGAPLVNHWPNGARPAKTELSDRISKDLAKRGFKFVGSTIIYAYMQAIGMVDDHDLTCFRRKPG